MGAERLRPPCFVLTVLAAGLAGEACAGVSTDGTVGPRVQLAGPEFAIGSELGTRAGPNLFHSFEKFSLSAGERATFSGPDAIRSIISRVTGGERSDIDGTLRSTIPGADLYFINPAGVLFGPNARLDLKGSFHVSTADELRFADGAVFSATRPAASSLTVAAPEAFGFLGAGPRALHIAGSTFEIPNGRDMSLVGGDVAIEDGAQLLLIGEGGRLRVAGDDVAIRGGALIDVARVAADGTDSGALSIDARTLRVSGGAIVASENLSARAGAPITIRAEALEMTDGAEISASTFGNGGAGSITLDADRIRIEGGTLGRPSGVIGQALPGSSGQGAAIAVTADTINLGAGGEIRSSAFGSGGGGDVRISAAQIAVDNAGSDAVAGIQSFSEITATGRSGDVLIEARRLSLAGGGLIGTAGLGMGVAGDVRINAARIDVSGRGLLPSGITTTALAEGNAEFDAGSISIAGERLTLADGAFINADNSGTGRPGGITITVDDLRIEGALSNIRSTASGVPAASTAAGDGIRITARSSLVIQGANLAGLAFIEGSTLGARDAGQITIRTGSLLLPEFAQIDSSTFGNVDGGAITIVADRIELGQTAVITSLAADPRQILDPNLVHDPDFISEFTGRGGDITIRVAGVMALRGVNESPLLDLTEFVPQISAVATQSSTLGGSGAIDIRAGRLVLDAGLISSGGIGGGDAGAIRLNVTDRLQLADQSVINSSSLKAGGGQIEIEAGRLIDLDRHSIIASTVFGGGGTAGDITIDPDFLVLSDSQILARAAAGSGGNIRIEAGQLVLSPGSRIDASADTGIDGTVLVSSPESDLSAGLVILDASVLDASSQLRARCGARRDIGASSFTGVGPAGLPPSPDGPLASGYLGAEPAPASVAAALPAAGPGAALVLPCAPRS